MSKSIFHFKQFSVNQDGSAMKINTDGVLLAAKATASHPTTILDIGAGTGVISLMLAQRFSNAVIDALEINEDATICARKNFSASPFATRLNVYATDFQIFNPRIQYDLIISNPPFFVNSLKNPDQAKMIARHAQEDFFEHLFSRAYEWLSDEGSFQVILPSSIKEFVVEKGFLDQWCIHHAVLIRSFEHSEVIRVILSLSKQKKEYSQEDFVIYQEKGIYSKDYESLLQPFFLKF